jgi:phage baseplate assembly protein W
MIPQLTSPQIKVTEHADKTYALGNRNLYLSGLEAVRQSVYLILNTARYEYPIYSWNYGFEYRDLIGREHSYVYSELERRITEALATDTRIKRVADFEFDTKGSKTHVKFSVATIYGSYEDEVDIDV